MSLRGERPSLEICYLTLCAKWGSAPSVLFIKTNLFSFSGPLILPIKNNSDIYKVLICLLSSNNFFIFFTVGLDQDCEGLK